jgi:predicted DsbA family dithiol-disulfide isomerase
MVAALHFEYWADYICPWCYLALDRVDHLVSTHGVEVRWRPFELHPEIPAGGETIPPIAKSRDSKRWLREQLDAAGLRTTRRNHWSNSRKALALSVWAEQRPEWPDLHHALYRAYFADGIDIDDERELARLAASAGISETDATGAIAAGAGMEAVARSRDAALDLGIANTPGWHLGDGIAFTGVYERERFDRVVRRAMAREESRIETDPHT